jgi:phosphomannomutase
MTQRILSISGLRGIVGDGLDPEYVTHFAATLGSLAGPGPIVVARDGRETGPMLWHSVVAGLMATGRRVLDLGIASTPTCGVMVRHLEAAGGLQMTASHNPPPWNGLKPFLPTGSVFDAAAGQRLLAALEQSPAWKSFDGLGEVERVDNANKIHLGKILPLVNVSAIRGRKLRVVLDCNHGSGGVLGPVLLRELGCDVTVLGETPDGKFEHTPEPLRENLTGLVDVVQKLSADVGFAQDPDADRLAIVDNRGRYIGEELTLALCADHRLNQHKGPVVVNGSTSRATADLAEKHGCPFHRSHVGEANVVSLMRQVGAVLGGEGNGGIIEPRVGYVRDSFVGMAYVLDALANRDGTLADWVDTLPKYSIVKDKVTCPQSAVAPACRALIQKFTDAQATEGDGLRLDWNDSWVQVRASNTEPIIRVIAEAPRDETARQLCQSALDIVRQVASAAS